MRIVERFDQRDVIQQAEPLLHHRAHIGVEVDREDHRNIIASRDPADRRAWQVHLTDRSRPMIEGLRGCVEQLNDDMQAGLTAEQRSVLASALEQVRMNLGGNPAPAYRTSVNG